MKKKHAGTRQDVLMRVVSRHLTALDRQVEESVNILESGKVPEESLNSKNEWGGDKPHLYWYPPQREWHQAVGKWRKARKAPCHREVLRQALRTGQKRIRYMESPLLTLEMRMGKKIAWERTTLNKEGRRKEGR